MYLLVGADGELAADLDEKVSEYLDDRRLANILDVVHLLLVYGVYGWARDLWIG